MAAEFLVAMGEKIRRRREELHMTQEDVARQMPGRVTGARVSLWERGKHRPHDDSLEALAGVLQVPVSYFMAPEPDKTFTPSPFAEQEAPPAWARRLQESVDEEFAVARRERVDMQRLIDEQNQLLARQSELLAKIEALVLSESVRELLDAVQEESETVERGRRALVEGDRARDRRRREAG